MHMQVPPPRDVQGGHIPLYVGLCRKQPRHILEQDIHIVGGGGFLEAVFDSSR